MSSTRKLQLVKTLTLSVLLAMMGTTVYAAGLGAPHNASRGIGCMSCHDLASSDANHVPLLDHTVTGPDDTINNNLCWSCHTDSGTVSPAHIITETHSSTSLGTSAYGDFTIDCSVCHNQHVQETTGGNFVRSNINLSRIQYSGTSFSKSGNRAVTYVGSTGLVTGSGDGICQVCHTLTAYYTNDGNNQGHNAGSNCTACHEHSSSFKPGADHSTFIVNDQSTPNGTYSCSDCHTNYPTNPESAHNDCNSCHASISPVVLIDSNFFNASGQPDWDGASMFDNMGASVGGYDTSYNTSSRLLDTNGAGIADTGFIAIKCGFCHAAKPAALENTAAPTHGGHSASHFGFDGNCADCHSGEVVKDVHSNNCDACHSGSTYNATTEKVGDSLNGVDGDATNADGAASATEPFDSNVYVCSTCHDVTGSAAINAASTGGIHHDNKSNNTDCFGCHTSGTHQDSHVAQIAGGATGCDTSGCHDATVGTTATAPIANADAKIHDACTTCHVIAGSPAADGQLVTVSGSTKGVPDGALPNGGDNAATNGTNGGGTCSDCHTSWSFTSHTHSHTTVTSVAPCSSCHTGDVINGQTTAEVNQGTHEGNCADCHNLTTGARVNGAANLGSYGGVSVNVGDATVNGSAGGTCAECHNNPQYFDGHRHTHNLVAQAECATCHDDGTRTDTNARDAKTAPFVGTGEVHATNGCATCHDLGASPTGALIGSAVGAAANADCVDCHITTAGKTWTTIHNGALGTGRVDHADPDTLVANSTNCSGCHANVAGSNARDAITTPFIAAGEVHNGSGCNTCHAGDYTGALRSTGLSKADMVASGNCTTCHTSTSTWTTIHDTPTGAETGVSHANRVDGLATCTSCHTDTAGGAAGVMPYNAGDAKVHDACATCHQTSGILQTGTTTYGGQTLAPGDCGTCHTTTYFDNHVHGTDAGYVSHDLTFSATLDESQGGGAGNFCYDCHDDAGLGKGTSALSTWNSIKTEHATVGGTAQTSVCATCHDYGTNGNQSGDADTPLLSTVNTVISSGTGVTCVTCHVPKDFNASPATSGHGGHSAATFSADASCTTCHNDGGQGVVAGIHNDTCTLCHSSGSGGAGTAKVGANGDGDATIAAALTDYTTASCLTCHDVTDADVTPASVGGIHHNNTGSVTYDTTACTDCHTAVDHAAMIDDTPGDCNSCHTLTEAQAGVNPPVSTGDPKVHDACVTCHEFAAAPDYNGSLIAPPGTKGVTVMPDGGTIGGTDGGGTCVTCHTANKKTMHHGSTLATSGTCQACHVNSPTTGVGTTAPQQMACRECHVDETQTGLRIVSLRLANGSGTNPQSMKNTNSGINGSLGVVATDASGYVTAHDISHTSTIAVNDYRSCFACHNGSYTGAAAVAPFHGYPGDAGTGYIKTSTLSGYNTTTNKTVLGGIDVDTVLDEDTAADNVNSMPLAFMYYHPGHITFRRFGETRTMSRRSSANGYADNGQLYRNNGNYANAIRRNAYLQATVEDYYRVAGNTFPNGECTHGGGNNLTGAQAIACMERKTGAGLAHETPVTGYALRLANVPYSNFSASDGQAPANTGYGNLSNIPYFTALASPNDRVFINSAVVDTNGDLLVIAGNDQGCGLLTVRTQPDNTSRGTMTLNGATGYCEKTVTSVSPVPTTVDVTSSGTGTPSVTGFTVTDNSAQPGVVSLSSATYSVAESGASVTITVDRTGGSGAASVNYATSNGTATAGSDYTAASGTLTWIDGETGNKTFTISITNDGTTESDETVNIALSNAVTASLGTPGTAVLTIVDDDQPGTLSFELGSYTVAEGGGSLAINVTRTAGTVGAVSVNYATSNGTAVAGSDYTAASGTLNWADADGVNKSFSIPITQDALVEGDETVTITLASATGGAAIGTTNPVTLTITDDDNTAPTISISQPAAGATGQQGTYDITYTLTDPDDAATVSFYYDTDAVGYNGTLVAGATCSGAGEGTDVTCSWDTSGLADGTYYVYGIATDGVNAPVNSAYSGDLTLTAPTCTDTLARYSTDAGTGTYGGMTANWSCGSAAPGMVGILTAETSFPGTHSCTDDRLNYSGSTGVQATWIMTTPYTVDTPINGTIGGTISAYMRDRDSAAGTVRFEVGYVTGGSFTSIGFVDQSVASGARQTYTMDISGISGTAPANSVLAIRLLDQSGQADRTYLGTADDATGSIRFEITECK